MKRRKPDEREIVRILKKEIRSDLGQLRATFERVRDQLDAQARSDEPTA